MNNIEHTLPYNWKPRTYQERFYDSFPKIYISPRDLYNPNVYEMDYDVFRAWADIQNETRYNYAYIDKTRRYGFDLQSLNTCVKEAQIRVGNYYHVFPTFVQGRRDLWENKTKDGVPFLNYIPDYLVKNIRKDFMQVEFANGSIYQVVGSDNYEALRGAGTVGYVWSEYAFQDPQGFIISQPVSMENKGWNLFGTTPFGYNHAFELRNIAKKSSDWYYELTTCEDAKYIDDDGQWQYAIHPDDIKAIETMSEEQKRREFWCDYDSEMPGAYYGKYMRIAKEQSRLTNVPVLSQIPVNTFWDLGIGVKNGATAIWFVQIAGKEIRLPNYYENTGLGLSHYINYMTDWRDKNDVRYGNHYLPHDAGIKSLQTGASLQDEFKKYGIHTKLIPRTDDVGLGIENCRIVLGQCWFDEKNCERGILCLKSYRKELNQKTGLWVHVHDWASHGADAFRTFSDWHKLEQPTIPSKPSVINMYGYNEMQSSFKEKEGWMIN